MKYDYNENERITVSTMKNYLGKRILVTGGAGFFGSHLCERLLNDGEEVLCVDNFYTSRRANIAHLLTNRNLLNG